MKKFLLVLSFTLIISLMGCSGQTAPKPDPTSPPKPFKEKSDQKMPNVYFENNSEEQVKKIIGEDVALNILMAYKAYNYKFSIGSIDKISIDTPQKINLTGSSQDYIVKPVMTTKTHEKIPATLIYTFVNNKYSMGFYDFELNRVSLALKNNSDLDGDNRNELIFEQNMKTNYYEKTSLFILKYIDGEIKKVMDENLKEVSDFFPLNYNNTYKVVADAKDPKKYNIEFKLSTKYDKNIKLTDHQIEKIFNGKIPDPVDTTILFTFDGKKYVPDKDVSDYKKYYKRYYNDLRGDPINKGIQQ